MILSFLYPAEFFATPCASILQEHIPLTSKEAKIRHHSHALLNRFTKRHQRNFYQLKMLAGKWDSNNGNKQNDTEENMYHRSIQPTTKQPYNIAQQIKATGASRITNHLPPKRPQHQPCDFKTLQTPGNTNNSNTQYNATKQITERSSKAAEDQPDDIAEKIH